MSTRRPRWIWMLPGVLAAIGVASPLLAQPQPQPAPTTTTATPTPTPPTPTPPEAAQVIADARRAYAEGTEHFNAGHFAEALAAFERAFSLRSNPVVLKPIAECHERLGHVPEAIAALERYLTELPTAADHTQLEARLAVLQRRPARVTVTSEPDGAQIVVDGEPRSQRTPAAVDVPPGHHRITAALTGYAATERELDVGAGIEASVGVTLARTSPQGQAGGAVPVAVSPGRRVGAAVWVATAVAGAAAVAGTVFGVMALSDANDYELAPTQELLDRGQRNALLADVGFAASLLSAGVAVVVYFADRGRTETAATTSSSARLQLTGSGLRVTF